MWHRHLANLCYRAWANLLSALSSSTLNVIVFSVAIPVLIFLSVLLFNTRQAQKQGRNWKEVLKATIIPTFIGAGIIILAWMLLFAGSVAATIYRDHQTLASRNQSLLLQNGDLTERNKDLEAKLKEALNLPPKTILKPAPDRCWVSNHFGLPNSTIKGAVTATAVIFHCNHKVAAPWQVSATFDRDFIPGAVVPIDVGTWFPGGARKSGLTYSFTFNNPPLLSDQVIVMTVYGPTDQYPHAISGAIEELH